MMKANKDLRALIEEKGLYYWLVADAYGCSDATLSKMLRRELPEEKKERVRKAIQKAENEMRGVS